MAEAATPKVGIIMGSQSDWETMKEAALILEALDVPHETRIVSAHRTPVRMAEYASAAKGRGLKVIIAGAGGESLSKRLGSLSLASLREGGLEAMTLNGYLARLGTPDPVEPFTDLAALAEGFDLSRFGRATPKFDPAELEHLNARLLHVTPYEAVAARLPEGFDAGLWQAVRPNLTRLAEAAVWQNICRGPVIPQIEEADFARQAAELLPPEPWDETTWGAWTGAVKAATGRKGKALFLPLRLALTGLDHGPELKTLLPLIGHERAEARLAGKTA